MSEKCTIHNHVLILLADAKASRTVWWHLRVLFCLVNKQIVNSTGNTLQATHIHWSAVRSMHSLLLAFQSFKSCLKVFSRHVLLLIEGCNSHLSTWSGLNSIRGIGTKGMYLTHQHSREIRI